METFIRFLSNDWYLAIPLFLMSFTGTGLVIWRLLLNINGGTAMSEFLPKFRDRLERDGIYGALAYCRCRTDIIPRRLFAAGLSNHRFGLTAVRRAMNDVIERQIRKELDYLLPAMTVVAKVATMGGILATAVSIANTFASAQRSSGAGLNDPTQDLSLSLFGTGMGLFAAIPLVFARELFKAWNVKFEARMKAAAWDLLGLLGVDRN